MSTIETRTRAFCKDTERQAAREPVGTSTAEWRTAYAGGWWTGVSAVTSKRQVEPGPHQAAWIKGYVAGRANRHDHGEHCDTNEGPCATDPKECAACLHGSHAVYGDAE